MTRLKIFCALAMALTALAAQAQLTADKAFTSAPAAVFPLLDHNTRLDMVDYYNAGQQTPSNNVFDGKSRITEMTPQSLNISMTDASQVQIFVLPAAKGDSIVGVITTVATPGHDSSLALYDRKWARLTNCFTAPLLANWLIDRGRSAEVEMVVPFMLTGYSYDPSTSTLTLTNNLESFLSHDIYSSVKPLMKPTLTYVWNGKRFMPAK